MSSIQHTSSHLKHSFHECLLNTYYRSDIVLGAEDEMLNKTGEAPALSSKRERIITECPRKSISKRVLGSNRDPEENKSV